MAYRKEFSIGSQKMQYVAAQAEQIPFPDNSFDVVSSFMSLKHVIGVEAAIDEIIRVTAPGGHFLIRTPVNSPPNTREPSSITWDIVDEFCRRMRFIEGFYGAPRSAKRARRSLGFRPWHPTDRPNEWLGRVSLRAIFTKM
jgi:ubiquinone/menaquinone biosynthesis C-methylase UbiE